MRVLAQVLRAVPTQTPQGGRVVFHEPVGSVWLKLGARRRREREDAGVLRVSEVLKAEVRADPRLEEGLLVQFGGSDWTVTGLDPAGAGYRVLEMERVR
ncbi:head-tail adaptor protein [Brevundimonas sp.]|uniref:head-tail adaptor protein n=1 Tax=Brevundimonas sp. TaxID=1871086 RepID=UPI002FC83DCB